MPTTASDLLDYIAENGATPELNAQLNKSIGLFAGVSAISLTTLTADVFADIKDGFAEIGTPPEALAELEKIKTLLINSES